MFKRALGGFLGLCSGAAMAVCAQAADIPAVDAALSYSARHTVELSDNDIFRATLGYTTSALDGSLRFALEPGVRNEYFQDGGGDPVGGAEVLFARRVGNQRYGLGARVRSASDRGTTGELAYAFENFATRMDLRGLMGIQALDKPEEVIGRDGGSLFAQGEMGFYVHDNWIISAGLMADSDGLIAGFGTEYRPRGWRASLFLEWGHAVDEYRGIPDYNDLTGGIRFVSKSKSLKSYRRASTARVMHRYVEVQ